MTYVYLNSRLVPAAAAMVSVFDRGLAYGDSLIEILKILRGQPVFFADHYRRLKNSMEKTGIGSPIDAEGLRDQALALAEANRVDDGRLRIQLTRGLPASPGGIDPHEGIEPTLLLTAEPFAGFPGEIYEKGIACATIAANRGSLARLKNGSLLATVTARREAAAAGAGEAIFTSGHGRLLEGSLSNIFFSLNGGHHQGGDSLNGGEITLLTPGEDQQILPGIVRGKVIGIAEEMGIEVHYEAPKLGELRAGEDAAFLTSSILGVCLVREIDGKEMALEMGLTGFLNCRLVELELASIA
ncbi:MAG: aminotransferase class IV [Actinobacteria bacterium]|nr:aminotransferase class IV [Actinomycetota bacterium]MCL5883262.1 aminotransferase class IV [Actinomycetota bacterium]